MASAEDYAGWIVANQDKRGTPEFETVAAAYQMAKGQKSTPKAEPTLPEKIAGSAPVRFAIGAAEPVIGAAQMVANTIHPDVGNAVNEHLQRLEGMIQAGRGQDAGFDAARFAGNVASPVNAGMAKVMPTATTGLGRVGVGASAGAIGGGLQPVTEQGNFWQHKAAQTGVGALGGGVATPILGKLTDALAPRIEALAAKFSTTRNIAQNARAHAETDAAIEQSLKEIGAKAEDMGAQQLSDLRKQVLASLQKGKMQDPAALLREQDFKAVGVDPTLGQLTRDSTQFARERNLRGVAGVGDPLQVRFDKQNQQMQQLINTLRGNPSEPYQAGRSMVDTLAGVDKEMQGRVSSLYKAARESAGKDADVPLAGLANDYAQVLDNFGDKVPSGVRNQFRKFGMEGENQTKVFTVEEADKLLKTINDHVGADTATNKALTALRNSVKKAITDDAGVEDVFSNARKAAAQRFGLHEAVPALEASANGHVAPDDFVRRYVLNGKTEEVQKLAEVLKRTNPEAYQEARAQIGDKITRAAFGENTAGDKLVAPERLAKALREIGTDKLRAFYSPDEIAQFKTLSRVAAYINSTPGSAAVNTSNNIGAITGLASRIPGIPAGVAIANALRNTISNASTVNKGVAAQIPVTTAKPSPEQARQLAKLLTASGFGAGVAGASAVR